MATKLSALQEQISTLQWMILQLDSFKAVKPKENLDFIDFSSSISTPVTDHASSASIKNLDFQNDPLAVWSVQRLQEEITNLPQGTTGFENFTRSVNRIKENIRQKAWGQKIILLWDARTTALSTMSMKDFLRAINETFFIGFPEIYQTMTVLLAQWNNQKSAVKAVLDAQVVSCSAFTIRKILDQKKFEQEKRGQVPLEGLSSKTRNFVMKALNESTSQRGRGRGRGHYRGQSRGRGGRGRGRYRGQSNSTTPSNSSSQSSSQPPSYSQASQN